MCQFKGACWACNIVLYKMSVPGSSLEQRFAPNYKFGRGARRSLGSVGLNWCVSRHFGIFHLGWIGTNWCLAKVYEVFINRRRHWSVAILWFLWIHWEHVERAVSISFGSGCVLIILFHRYSSSSSSSSYSFIVKMTNATYITCVR